MEKAIKELALHAIKGTVPSGSEYSHNDVNATLADALKKLCPNFNAYRRNKFDIFELLQESLDLAMQQDITAVFEKFADIKQVKQNQKVTYKKKLGKRRGEQFVTRVGLSGVFETFRLDSENYEVPVTAIGGAANIDLERLLDGAETLEEYRNIILDGIEETVYKMLQGALVAVDKEMPTANNLTMTTTNADAMEEGINIVSAYGKPVIFCTRKFASKLSNIVYGTKTDFIANSDTEQLKSQGYIGAYHGADIVILPQGYTDETNAEEQIDSSVAYILPAGVKIANIVFEGDTIVDDVKQADSSYEIQAYKKVGVALTSYNNWVKIKNTSITK